MLEFGLTDLFLMNAVRICLDINNGNLFSHKYALETKS